MRPTAMPKTAIRFFKRSTCLFNFSMNFLAVNASTTTKNFLSLREQCSTVKREDDFLYLVLNWPKLGYKIRSFPSKKNSPMHLAKMLEQSVKLSQLIIFYFISNFLVYALILPNWEPKTSAFRSVFVFRAVFQLLYSCFGRKSKCAANANHCGFCSKLVRSGSKFCAI